MILGCVVSTVTGALQIFRASRPTNLKPVARAGNPTSKRGYVSVDMKRTGIRFAGAETSNISVSHGLEPLMEDQY